MSPFVDPNTVHNPSAGAVAPSAWGDTVRDDLVFLSSPPRGSASHSTTENHNSSGNWLGLSANTEAKDTDAAHSTSTNTGRVTIVTPGDYLFEAVIEWQANTTGVRGAKLVENGATDHFGELFPASTTGAHRTTITALITGLAAADYVQPYGYQNSGGTLTMQLLRYSWLYVGI